MTNNEMILVGGALFFLTKKGQEIITQTPQGPLDQCKKQYEIWQTYTAQSEKNAQVELYFRECGYTDSSTGSWAWCQALVSFCCLRSNIPLKSGKQFISTGECLTHYKNAGLLKSTPVVGDFGIMALNDGIKPNHVGFVSNIVDESSHVQFLEGNYSGGLAYVERKATLPKVLGYVSPVRGDNA